MGCRRAHLPPRETKEEGLRWSGPARQGSSGGVDQWGQRVAGPCRGRGGGGGSGEDVNGGDKQACAGGRVSPERGLDGATGGSCARRAGEAARPRGPGSAPGKWPPSSRPCRSARTPSPSPWRAGRLPASVRPCAALGRVAPRPEARRPPPPQLQSPQPRLLHVKPAAGSAHPASPRAPPSVGKDQSESERARRHFRGGGAGAEFRWKRPGPEEMA